jgi:hypothetical protein
MRGFALLLALGACSQEAARVDVAALQACSVIARTGELTPAECRLAVGDDVARVTYEAVAEGAAGGSVRVDVLNDAGAVAQTFTESNVSEYLAPNVEDVDGDGRADILAPLSSGNVNTAYAVWLYNGDAGAYRRAGELSGVEFARTSEGYIAVSARSSAASWNVAFYRLGEQTFEPLVTVNVTANDVIDDGRVLRSTCIIEAAPGLASLNLTEDAARAKFCAEPAAGVFEP